MKEQHILKSGIKFILLYREFISKFSNKKQGRERGALLSLTIHNLMVN